MSSASYVYMQNLGVKKYTLKSLQFCLFTVEVAVAENKFHFNFYAKQGHFKPGVLCFCFSFEVFLNSICQLLPTKF